MSEQADVFQGLVIVAEYAHSEYVFIKAALTNDFWSCAIPIASSIKPFQRFDRFLRHGFLIKGIFRGLLLNLPIVTVKAKKK